MDLNKNCRLSLMIALIGVSDGSTDEVFGCKADSTLCSAAGGVCNNLGFCTCKEYYTGATCSDYVSKDIEFVIGGITDGGLAAIIMAWIFLPPIIIFLVSYFIHTFIYSLFFRSALLFVNGSLIESLTNYHFYPFFNYPTF
jgi:hypothetical protein